MSAIPYKESTKSKIFRWTKNSVTLSTIAAFIICNLITIILTGGFSILGLITNLFPTIMAFFVSSMYNEQRRENLLKEKKAREF